jgi:hypothetical protein
VKRSIETGFLYLNGAEKRSYSLSGTGRVVCYIWIPYALLVWLFDMTTDKPIGETLLLITVVLQISIVLLLTLVKLRDLRFLKTETSLREDVVRQLIVRFSPIYQWTVCNNRKTLIILKSGPGRSGSGGWGERITVLIQNGSVWFNSITDPDRRSAWRSLWRNRGNLSHIRQVLSGYWVPESKKVHRIQDLRS